MNNSNEITNNLETLEKKKQISDPIIELSKSSEPKSIFSIWSYLRSCYLGKNTTINKQDKQEDLEAKVEATKAFEAAEELEVKAVEELEVKAVEEVQVQAVEEEVQVPAVEVQVQAVEVQVPAVEVQVQVEVPAVEVQVQVEVPAVEEEVQAKKEDQEADKEVETILEKATINILENLNE